MMMIATMITRNNFVLYPANTQPKIQERVPARTPSLTLPIGTCPIMSESR